MTKIHFSTIQGRTRKTQIIQIPENWMECSTEQAMKSIPYAIRKHLNEQEKLGLLRVFIKKRHLLALEDIQVVELLKLIEWVSNQPLDVPILPCFLHGNLFFKTKYFLPEEKLKNITCQEWHLADEYYNAYVKDGKSENLNRLIATLCRPEEKKEKQVYVNEDTRTVLLSRKEVEHRAKQFNNLEQTIKLYILFFFSGCKDWIYNTYKPFLFPDEFSVATNGTKPLPFGFYSLFQTVAESGVFGTLENILLRVKFHEFCAYLITKKTQYDNMRKGQEAVKLKNKL